MRNVFIGISVFALILGLAFPVQTRGEKIPTLSDEMKAKFLDIRWIGFAPTNYNPDPQHEKIPTDESLRADLFKIRNTGWDGLVLYGSGIPQIPRIAEEIGFRGVLLGVWDPNNADELATAREAAKSDIVLGVIIGNEGLMFNRYDFATLKNTVEEMALATRKPVTTTEVIESYLTNTALLKLSSFVLPNAHPYHHSIKEPRQAVEWTVKTFEALQKQTDKLVLLKEVGLPTAGDTGLTEQAQAEYYDLLRDTPVHFVYFEAFDGPWKQWGKTEPHWGLFRADRSEKPVIRRLQFVLDVSHKYVPSGWMGDGEKGKEAIEVSSAWKDQPHSEPTCYKWVYKSGGPKGWAAVAWQYPEHNWGERKGLDLTGYKRLTFWIRGQNGGEVVSIKAGGHTSPFAHHPASFEVSSGFIVLKDRWEKKEIDLTNNNLSNTVSAFSWVVREMENPNGCTFYLDDIRYER